MMKCHVTTKACVYQYNKTVCVFGPINVQNLLTHKKYYPYSLTLRRVSDEFHCSQLSILKPPGGTLTTLTTTSVSSQTLAVEQQCHKRRDTDSKAHPHHIPGGQSFKD